MRFFSLVVSCLLVVGCKDSAGDFEKLADRACECALEDTACGTKVLGEVAKFTESNKTSSGDIHRINEAGKRMYQCLANTGIRANDLTAALEKMVD